MTSSSPKAITEAHSMTTTTPTDIDVLCGRGGAAIQHPGNIAYRAMVESERSLYQSSEKFKKREISKSIVAMIRNQGGRFLQKQEPSGKSSAAFSPTSEIVWFEIGDQKAIAKTCQALRERFTKKSLSDIVVESNKRSAHLRQKRVISERSKKRSKRSSDRPSQAAKTKSHHSNHLEMKAKEDTEENAVREPIAILNGLSYTNGCGGWEWKLFDFCDEEQTRQVDQLVPHQCPSPPPPPPPSSFPPSCLSAQSQPETMQLQLQLSPHPAMDHMISSSTLYGYMNTQSLAPPALTPQISAIRVKKGY